MNCDVIRDLLPLYMDELTSPNTNQQIEAHLQSCPACRDTLAKLSTPIETCHSENIDYIKPLRKHLRKRRIQNLCIILLVPILILLFRWIHIQIHFPEYNSHVDTTNPTFILKKEPRAELTLDEIELARILFSHPAVQEAFPEEGYIPLEPSLVKDVLLDYLPENADISGITLLDDYMILSYQHNGTISCLEYSDPDHTGFVDLIQKTVATPEKSGDVKYFYIAKYNTATRETEYERWSTYRNWFSLGS